MGRKLQQSELLGGRGLNRVSELLASLRPFVSPLTLILSMCLLLGFARSFPPSVGPLGCQTPGGLPGWFYLGPWPHSVPYSMWCAAAHLSFSVPFNTSNSIQRAKKMVWHLWPTAWSISSGTPSQRHTVTRVGRNLEVCSCEPPRGSDLPAKTGRIDLGSEDSLRFSLLAWKWSVDWLTKWLERRSRTSTPWSCQTRPLAATM